MSVKLMDIILSIALGFVAIYIVHGFIVTDACLDTGGFIEPESGLCND